jgi:fibronectin-binding autotransporter adhesin
MNRLRYFAYPSVLLFCIVFSSTSAQAAITPTGNVQPNLPWNTNTGALIGRTSDGSLLVDGGSVLTSLDGNLGFNAGVTGEVTVADPGSQWNLRGALTVGRNGIGILNIEGGGQVIGDATTTPYLGRNAGSLGTATVTGAGSKLIGGYMRVGEEGTGTLNVTAGGLVTSTSAMIGYEDTATGAAVVSGAGSQWNVEGGMRVGWNGNGSLRIESGGRVSSGNNFNSWLAYQPESTGAVTVTGAGSQWTSGFQLYVGHRGQATVDVTDGGVINTLSTKLGFDPGASGTVTVTGVGSKWNNTSLFEVGTSGIGKLTVADGGEVTTGTLYASLADLFGNGTISATKGAVVDATLSFDAAHGTTAQTSFGLGGTLKVTAAGGDLGVGYKTSGIMSVTDGVQITSNLGYLAYKPGSTGTATVSGVGSKWTTTDDLNVGYRGNGSLTVDSGGKVASARLLVGRSPGKGTLNINSGGQVSSSVGTISGSSVQDSLATVSGSNSRWDVSDTLVVGGKIRIESGGQVTSATGSVNGYPGGMAEAKVTGPGSQWTVSETLTVYEQDALVVEDGGKVVASTLSASLGNLQGNGTIVAMSGAHLDADFVFDAAHPNQQVFAFGSGGTLTVNTGGELGVGFRGKGTLQILDGVTVHSTNGSIRGSLDTQSEGKVSGTGSQWALSGSLGVGGLLTIEQGGKVTSATGIVENGNSTDYSPPGIVTVMDVGSEWVNSGELNVGYNGTGTLIIKEGGVVRNTDGYLGRDQYEYGVGKAFVMGAGSQWINSGALTVGLLGLGEMTITDGGQVSSNTGNIFGFSGDIVTGGGRITVSGAGSKWTIDEDLTIESYANSLNYPSIYPAIGFLTIENGGEVNNAKGNVMLGATVTVKGAGSRWINNDYLQFGSMGTSYLTIEAGGYVSSTGGLLGTGDSFNQSFSVATITGQGSVWNAANVQQPYNGTFLIGTGSTMNLRDGGQAVATRWDVFGLATIDVGSGSLFKVGAGSGQVQNYGTIRVVAGANAVPGSQHSPIAAGTWTGPGAYQAVGGTWDAVNHVFTVSETIESISGTPLVTDLSQHQRVLIEDTARGRNLGISLQAKSGLATITATTIDSAILDKLIESDRQVVSGWDFAVSGNGYAVGDPLFLSFVVPPALDRSALSLWQYDGQFWQSFNAPDLSVSGGSASFTVANGGVYALTMFVPEPGTQLLGILVAAICAMSRKSFGCHRLAV